MTHKLSILYSWFVRLSTCYLPNVPLLMRFRGFLYSLMMKQCGRNFQVASNSYLNSLSGLIVGDNVYIGPNVVMIGIDIRIGKNALIGPNCVISGGNHQFDGSSFRFKKSRGGAVVIEEGTWVAGNCTITESSRLPKNSILAAGSVLTKNYKNQKKVYGGIPAKEIGVVK